MEKTFRNICLLGALITGACATTTPAPAPTSTSTATTSATKTNGVAEASPTNGVRADLLDVWNRTDLHVPLSQWPGKMVIKGSWGTVKELRRALKLHNADISESDTALYGQDDYMLKAYRQTRSILSGYTSDASDEMIEQFMASPWAKRYMRYDYVSKLAKDCDVPLSDAQLEALRAYRDLKGPNPPAWNCSSNPQLKERPLP